MNGERKLRCPETGCKDLIVATIRTDGKPEIVQKAEAVRVEVIVSDLNASQVAALGVFHVPPQEGYDGPPRHTIR